MRKQRGMVLILAMLIVVLVITITVSLSWRYNLSMTRNENRWHGLQARAYLEGAEAFASIVLQEDAEEDQRTGLVKDSLGEWWAQPLPPQATDEGWVEGKVEDAQGRFNLNLLQQRAQTPQGGNPSSPQTLQYTASQERFIRLLQTFEFEDGVIDQAQATEITQAVMDWLDLNHDVTGFGGAEADYYQQLEPPTTPPNTEMISVSELSRVRGITPEIYQALLPLVIALPPDAKLNINTMPLPIMRTMAAANDLTPLTEEEAQLLLDARDTAGSAAGAGTQNQNQNQNQPAPGGFDTVQDFENSAALTALVGGSGNLDTADLGVTSKYFLVFSETLVGEQRRTGASMLKRDNGKVTIVRRSDANF